MEEFYKGSIHWVRSTSPSAGRGMRLSCAVLLPQGPRPGGIPPPRARGRSGETPRPPRSLAPPPRATSPQAPQLLRRPGPSPRPAMRGHCGGGSALRLVEKPTVNDSGFSPNAAGRGKGGGSEPHSQGELPGFPTWGRPFDVREARGGILGTFPGIHSQRRITPSAHIGYYDDTTTASCHSSRLSNPIALLSLLPWAPSYALQVSPRAEAGTAERTGARRGVLGVTVGRQGRQESKD